MPVPIQRILAFFVPVQAVLLMALAWYSTRPAQVPVLRPRSADLIVVETSSHKLTVYSQGLKLRTYAVALGRTKGAKEFQGDHKTPIGRYVVDGKNAHSQFHLALHLSYPNAADRTHAASAHRPPGGDVEIHGLRSVVSYLGRLQSLVDWTDGCIAMTDREMDELYRITPVGTPVDIRP